MSQEKNTEYEGKGELEENVHKPARPMKVVIDFMNTPWLCDADVDPSKDLKKQGCWRCDELAFTRSD